MLLKMRGDVIVFPLDSCNEMVFDANQMKKIEKILEKYDKCR